MQPFCNVVTVNVIQQGAVYTMDGYDDQCVSAAFVPGSVLEFAGFLSGATVDVVAAGSHRISVGSQCVSGTYTQVGGCSVGVYSVVVLP